MNVKNYIKSFKQYNLFKKVVCYHSLKITATIGLFLIAFFSFSQTDGLIKLSNTVQIKNDSILEIKYTIAIADGWHLFHKNNIDGLDDIIIESNYQKINSIFNKTPQSLKDEIFGNANVFEKEIILTETYNINTRNISLITAKFKGNIAKSTSFYPIEIPITISLQKSSQQNIIKPSFSNPKAACGGLQSTKNSSYLSIFIIGFLGGLLALLTPCVFPMLPVTVSFFTKKANNKKQAIKNGLLYGFFIFGFYVLASLPFHLLGNVQPEIFNNIATNEWLNLFFFAIFIFFAISFFGYFEISLPSSLSTKVDSKKGLGTISGIFFMALTLVIVSFSCTGPILGSLLVGSLNGGAWQLTAGLAGFGLSLALPFALFSTFPNLLQSLPKSGSWMDSLKKILAFVELALALKFLSNADLVKHWGLLKRETFIVIWIAILIALILYLIGKIKLPHEYVKKIPTWRKITAILVGIFTIYLLGGLFNFNKLQWLSGFPPPTNYSYQYKDTENKNQLHIINNYDSAIILAKQTHKLILLDFTGWACVNCRKMEENVWTNEKIAKLLAENFIILSLYVDDRNNLPNSQQFVYNKKEGSPQNIITVGDKWTLFEAENFKQVSQPLYAIINENEDLLNAPISFTPNINTYFNWLNCAINVNK